MAAIKNVTWVKDAAKQYVANREGSYAHTDTYEYDEILHVYVVYDDGTDAEWSSDWDRTMDPKFLDAIDWALGEDA